MRITVPGRMGPSDVCPDGGLRLSHWDQLQGLEWRALQAMGFTSTAPKTSPERARP